jgi:hypothetical protein
MSTYPIRFVIEDHSTSKAPCAVVRSTRTGATLACTKAPPENVAMELHRALGVPPIEVKHYRMHKQDRQKAADFWPHVSHDFPHTLEVTLRNAFLSDIM